MIEDLEKNKLNGWENDVKELSDEIKKCELMREQMNNDKYLSIEKVALFSDSYTAKI